MATKWRKFSRSKITKAVSLVLAIVFFALSALSGADLYARAVQSGESSDILESYLTGNGYKVTDGYYFRSTLSKYLEAALKTKLVFKNGSEKDYENYKKLAAAQGSASEKAELGALQKSFSSLSGGIEFGELLSALENGGITLKRLGGHECYLEDGVTLYQSGDGDDDYVIDKNGRYYDSYYDYYYNADDDFSETTFPTTVAPNNSAGTKTNIKETVTAPEYTEYYGDEDFHSRNAVPESIKKKAKDPSTIVEICSLRNTADKKTYDGYYEFTINEAKLRAQTAESFLGDTIKNYADFKEKARYYKNEFAKFSHAAITIADAETDEIVFSSFQSEENGELTLAKAETESNDAPLSFSYYSGQLSCGWNIAENSPTAENISRTCRTFTEGYMPFLSYYKLIVTTDDYFSDKQFENTVSSQEPFESALVESLAEQKTIRAELIRLAVFLVLFLILAVYLVAVAGKTPEGEEIKMLPADKIFTLLRTAINGLLIYLAVALAFYLLDIRFSVLESEGNSAPWFVTTLFALSAAGVCAFFLDWLCYIARHIRNRSILKNFFVVWLFKKLKKLAEARREALKNQPVVYKDIFNDVLKKVLLFGMLPNVLVGVPCVFSYGDGDLGALLFGALLAIYDLLALGYAVYYAFGVRKVFAALEEMRKGSTDIAIDVQNLPKAVKAAAVDAIHLGEGLKAAVENAVKEEKMKAELITNVSHDLKTPLTSIINYSDLLSRCDIQDETAKSYIAVLNEKSVRLKKLIEDLVEASKASSGAIRVEMRKVSLTELARQIAGEYEDEFSAKGLEIDAEGTERELYALADGKLCHRVLDNLFCNVKKYAMPNTRVYLTVSESPEGPFVMLKNISENKLNISPEELKARFVRGDEARSGEGNGLGLSIADNLCKLQGGKLELAIIGDLFCATVTFKRAE